MDRWRSLCSAGAAMERVTFSFPPEQRSSEVADDKVQGVVAEVPVEPAIANRANGACGEEWEWWYQPYTPKGYG